MAEVSPFAAIRYNPEHIRLGGVLAPPYDVIGETQRDALYGGDLRNIVRIDFGADYPDDEAGVNDRYTRAAKHLDAWLQLGILVREHEPTYYVSAHEFELPDGTPRRRLGVFATVAALPWERSDLRPHERTLRGPKQDRLALMRATGCQTSAVFGLWDHAPGIESVLTEVTSGSALLGGRTQGEFGSEKHLLWPVTDAEHRHAIHEALRPSRLYVADGHHRYETAVAYAAEAGPQAAHCLVYLCAAADPGLTVMPTHRLVRPRPGLPRSVAELEAQVGEGAQVVPVEDLDQAAHAARLRTSSHHAFGVALPEGAAMVAVARDPGSSPRDALDVVALERVLLTPLGIDAGQIAEGALSYSRDVAEVALAVAGGEAGLGVTVNATTVDQVMAVADAAMVMPQKSTYFYPKVPTGLVIAPLGR